MDGSWKVVLGIQRPPLNVSSGLKVVADVKESMESAII